ncbi:hypothetical protein [Halarcobacter anaerophilus]|jgi:hypothetical protein|uniref:Uncharacterized protein n=1 Tax=Halarcobacter anaerophilus TaxID=877500 RepID=A0A4V1LPX1_9BACT|nr:hypothetical protein [Halarcobacter anaerophilus]QDF29757.1 hypothetical protein AANAER_2298 [Halarcobacter anaerophilus]RXJ62678.1 hypothetical protein CRV06_09435 [Halarcobacter anaerophilus]
MSFIPVSTQLLNAIKSNNVNEVEELILNSDSRKELIIEHISYHGKDFLVNLLPQFKSKGLVTNIKTLLNIEE